MTLKDNITNRLQAMALLLDSIASLHGSGIISDEKALEQTNCYLNHINDIMKNIDNEEGVL